MKMKCPKCKSKNADRTCNTFKKGKRTKWTGYYCHDCGHFWEEGHMDEEKEMKMKSKNTDRKRYSIMKKVFKTLHISIGKLSQDLAQLEIKLANSFEKDEF